MLTLDSETCGLHGMPVLLQYAVDYGKINLWDIWKMPSKETIELLEWISTQDVTGFNLAFDWFHINKLWTTLLAWDKPNECPEDYIDQIAEAEFEAITLDKCLKPKSACDLMLHARKGPYQSLMKRKPLYIRRVPAVIAPDVMAELEEKVQMDGIYFANAADKNAPRWKMKPCKNAPEFRDIYLEFKPSGALKTLAKHALAVDKGKVLTFKDIEPDKVYRPVEVGWAPYALALSTASRSWAAKAKMGKKGVKEGFAWPGVIRHHIDHWAFHDRARQYAGDDITYTRGLYDHFGKPLHGDDDSELACMVGIVRWHGFSINYDKMMGQKIEAGERRKSAPIAATRVKPYIYEVMSDAEKAVTVSTNAKVLEKLAVQKCICKQVSSLENDPLNQFGFGDVDIKINDGPCAICKGTGIHPVQQRAKNVINARKAKKEEEIFDKLLMAKRFHASFIVIGTLSSRMAGADGLNAQGINRKKDIRECFTLADDPFILCGGDFDAFEVVIAVAGYSDPELEKAVTTEITCPLCDGKGECNSVDKKTKTRTGPVKTCEECEGHGKTVVKIHALFALELFPDKSYADILASKGTDYDLYSLGKAGIFAMLYGGNYLTLVTKQGVDEEVAMRAEIRFQERFPGVAIFRKGVEKMFCSMSQANGIGSAIKWEEPAEYMESLLGDRRYFTLENQICKVLYGMASKPPSKWTTYKHIKVMRDVKNQRIQTAAGATMSAVYGAIFGLQSANMRAAANHLIQSTGARITKAVQRKLWDVQPCGPSEFVVLPCNIHDEILSPVKPAYLDIVAKVIHDAVEHFRPTVPLIKFEWGIGWKSWAEK